MKATYIELLHVIGLFEKMTFDSIFIIFMEYLANWKCLSFTCLIQIIFYSTKFFRTTSSKLK